MPYKRLSLTAIVLAALACGQDTPPPPPITELTVSAAEYDAAPLLNLVPGLALCDAVAGECDLGSQVSAVPDLDGGTMLWEFAKVIRRYDSTGRHWADLGRKGKGPGEYDIAISASASPEELTVVDVSSLRLARFDASGSFREFTPLRSLPQTARQILLYEGGLVIFSVQPLSDGSGSSFRAVRRAASGAEDTLALHSLPGYGSNAGNMQKVPALFEAMPIWSMAKNGVVLFSPSKDFEVWQYQDGAAVKHLTVDHSPRKIEQAEVDRESAARLARASGPLRASVEDAIRRRPEFQPAITQLFSMTDGGMLLREAPDAAGDSVRWTRFSPEWKPNGYFMLAEDTRMLLVEPGRVLLSEELTGGVRVRWMLLP